MFGCPVGTLQQTSHVGPAGQSGPFTAAWDVGTRRRRFIELDLFVFVFSE
jgi:hypothetical protein